APSSPALSPGRAPVDAVPTMIGEAPRAEPSGALRREKSTPPPPSLGSSNLSDENTHILDRAGSGAARGVTGGGPSRGAAPEGPNEEPTVILDGSLGAAAQV